jgi:hypothetical protein
VEEASLTFRKIETNRCKSVSPREVVWGILGNAPATTPPCPTMEPDHAALRSVGAWAWILLSIMMFCPFL